MWLSKIWFALVAFAGAACLAFALMIFFVSSRELEREQAERLDRAQDNAQLLLKVNVRIWIDEAARLSADGELADGAEGYTKAVATTPAEAPVVHQNVQERLQKLNEKLRADMALVLDIDGKVVARAGVDQKAYGDGLIGFPLVQQVLRGYRRDDTWAHGGQLYRMAGSPIPSRARDRIVGAVLIGKRVDDQLARSLAERLGTDVIFYLAGKVVAKSSGSAVVFSVPALIQDHRETWRKEGRTPGLSVEFEGKQYQTVIAPLIGEAAELDACYALLSEKAVPSNVGALAERIGRDDVAFGKFPWWLIAGILIGVLGVGLILMTLEVDRPARRLLNESRDVAKGVSGKVNDAALRGKYGSVGRAINETIERLSRTKPGRDIGSILGSGVGTSGTASGTSPGENPGMGAMRQAQPSLRPTAALAGRPITGAQPSGQMAAQSAPLQPTPTPSAFKPLAPPISVTPAPVTHEPSGAIPTVDDGSLLQEESGEPDPEALEMYFRQIYKEFVETKRKCGETDSVTFERFADKLRDNRRQMVERFMCKDVKFIVYVKEGRAAVKATPVKA